MSVHHYANHGPQIGNYLGEPIYESIEEEGTVYIFDRIAESDDLGCPLDQLRKNEMLFNPGLIYRIS